MLIEVKPDSVLIPLTISWSSHAADARSNVW